MHQTFIRHTKQLLDPNSFIGKFIKPVPLHAFKESHTTLPDGRQVSPDCGETITTRKKPGCKKITYNTSHDSDFTDFFEAADTIFHESSHSFDAQIDYLFTHHRKMLPAWLLPDAAILHTQRVKSAYITAPTGIAYTEQCNEVIAFKAGQEAKNGFTFSLFNG